MNETRISIPLKCRFPATKFKEVERKRSEQSNATQGRARQGKARQVRAEREQGREGREEMKFLGVTFDRQGAPCRMPSVANQWICQNPGDNLMMEPDLVTRLGYII
jgi:hypothetical protein